MPWRAHYNNSHSIVMFDFDFVQKQTLVSYRTSTDVIADLGGIAMFYRILFWGVEPALALLFLIQLAAIIRYYYKTHYRKQLIQLAVDVHNQKAK